MPKRLFFLTLVALTVLLVVPASAKKGGGKGGGGKIPVTVALRDGSSDGLKSDGELYIDRDQNVTATVGPGFTLSLIKGSRPATARRELWFDLTQSRCVSEPPSECTVDSSFWLGPVAIDSGGVDLRQMLPGEERDLNLIIQLSLVPDDEVWWIFFNPDAVGCENSRPVKVTRPGAADTWVIRAESPDHACLIRQIGSPENVFSGLYYIPFEMTLQRKQ